MHEQESSRRARLLQQINERLEQLTRRPRSPEAVLHELRTGPVAVEVRNLMRRCGFTEDEIGGMMMGPHPKGCACWECVIGLYRAVRNSRR